MLENEKFDIAIVIVYIFALYISSLQLTGGYIPFNFTEPISLLYTIYITVCFRFTTKIIIHKHRIITKLPMIIVILNIASSFVDNHSKDTQNIDATTSRQHFP